MAQDQVGDDYEQMMSKQFWFIVQLIVYTSKEILEKKKNKTTFFLLGIKQSYELHKSPVPFSI